MSLPILSSQFFEKHSPDLGFFSKWQSLFHWSDQVLPIYEWQGILYVGCLQPPQNFPQTKQKVVFLLCAPDALKEVWYNFEGTVAATLPTPKPLNASPAVSAPQEEHVTADLAEFKLDLGVESANPVVTEPIVLESSPAVAESTAPVLEISLESPVEPIESSAPDQPSESSSEVSLELNFDSQVASGAKTEEAGLTPAEEIPVQQDDSPAALLEDAPSEDDISDRSIHTSAQGEEDGLLDLSGGQPPQESAAGPNTNSPSSPLISLERLAPATEAQAAAHEPKEELTPVEGVAANAQKRAAPATSEVLMSTSDAARASVQALSSASSNQLEPWTEKLFAEICAHYQKAMILLKSGDQVKPWKWTASFQPSTPSISSISLLQASPFRIVHRTHKPFHGYVIMNEINDKFFGQWNQGKVPTHMTITPIMIEDHVIGMLLALGESSADTKACLQMMETLAGNVAKQIQSSKTKAAS